VAVFIRLCLYMQQGRRGAQGLPRRRGASIVSSQSKTLYLAAMGRGLPFAFFWWLDDPLTHNFHVELLQSLLDDCWELGSNVAGAMIETGDVAQAEETLKEARGRQSIIDHLMVLFMESAKASAISSSQSPFLMRTSCVCVRAETCVRMASEGEDGAPSEAKLVQETSVLDLQASYPPSLSTFPIHYPSTWVCVPFQDLQERTVPQLRRKWPHDVMRLTK
jgi:hypothetical protein